MLSRLFKKRIGVPTVSGDAQVEKISPPMVKQGQASRTSSVQIYCNLLAIPQASLEYNELVSLEE